MKVGLYVEDGIVTVSTDDENVEVLVFNKDDYDEASDEARAKMEEERAKVEALPFTIAEL